MQRPLISVAESLPAKAIECLAHMRLSGLPKTPIRQPRVGHLSLQQTDLAKHAAILT